MKLHHKIMGEGEPLIVLHGLMGMLDNWVTPAKTLAEHFEVILVDQRNHGRSPKSEDFSYLLMADDLKELIFDLGYDEVHILGHSMGGKTAMKFAQNNPEFVLKMIVADIAPKRYPVHHEQILKGLSEVSLDEIKSRREAEEIMLPYIPEFGVRQFLLKNLHRKDKRYWDWRFNLAAIKETIEDIGEEIHDAQYNGEVLFMRGENSNYINVEGWGDIELLFPNAELVTIKNAGHWLHAENPKEFLIEAVKFLTA